MMEKIIGYILTQLSYYLRRAMHYMRMKHIEKGRDWRFYEQYTAEEILKMKLDGSEESKMKLWGHWRR